jgi:hypothetical protein
MQLPKALDQVTMGPIRDLHAPDLRHPSHPCPKVSELVSDRVATPTLIGYPYLLDVGGIMEPLARPSSQPAYESVLATVVAGAAIGAVLAILVGAAAFPAAVGPFAYIAIIVVGSTAGSAIGVLAVAVRRHR